MAEGAAADSRAALHNMAEAWLLMSEELLLSSGRLNMDGGQNASSTDKLQ